MAKNVNVVQPGAVNAALIMDAIPASKGKKKLRGRMWKIYFNVIISLFFKQYTLLFLKLLIPKFFSFLKPYFCLDSLCTTLVWLKSAFHVLINQIAVMGKPISRSFRMILL